MLRLVTGLLMVVGLVIGSTGVASADTVFGVADAGTAPAPPAEGPEIQRTESDVFINFDEDVEPCVFAETIALRDKYVALGVVFSGPGERDGGAEAGRDSGELQRFFGDAGSVCEGGGGEGCGGARGQAFPGRLVYCGMD